MPFWALHAEAAALLPGCAAVQSRTEVERCSVATGKAEGE